jgi:hypothetical protein
MKNYRRHSGDGSVKVVLSGDSNSPPKTTRRREPPSYNSSPTQEVCPSIPAVAADVRRLTYPANRLHDQTYSPCQPGVSSSGLRELCPSSVPSAKEDVFVSKGTFPSHPKFQKKPVFARIRGLSNSAGESPNVHFSPSESLCLRASVVKLSPSQNVDSRTSHQNPSKKARNVAYCRITEEISEAIFVALSPFHQNVDCALPTPSPPLPPVPNPQALFLHPLEFLTSSSQSEPGVSAKPGTFWPSTRHLQRKNLTLASFFYPNPTCSSHQNVDCFPWDLALENSLVTGFWSVVIPPSGPLSPQKRNFSLCSFCELGVFVFKRDLPSHQNLSKKARESAIVHVSTSPASPSALAFRTPVAVPGFKQNVDFPFGGRSGHFSRQAGGHGQCWTRMQLSEISAKRIWNSAVFWTWIYNGVRLASGVLLLLPLLNRYLSKEDFGMYWHFVYMVTLVPLLDATFSVTITRNVAYALSGVKDLQAVGIAELHEDRGPNLALLSNLLATTRRLYLYLCLFVVVILGVGGTAVLADKFKETTSFKIAVIAWIVTLISSPLELYTGSWLVFLRGLNKVVLTSRLITMVQLSKLFFASIFLIKGLGLLSVPLATLITAVGQRFVARYYCRTNLPEALPPPDHSTAHSLLLRLWPMSWRLGLQLLSGWVAINGLLTLAAQIGGLAEGSGSFGFSHNVLYVICLGMAGSWTFVKWPLICQLRASQDLRGMREVLWSRVWIQNLTFLALAGAAILIGPYLLEQWFPDKHLLPRAWLVLFAIYALLDMNVSFWTTLLSIENRIPSLWPVTFTQLAIVAVAALFVYPLHMGLKGLVLAPLICGALFNFWYWPMAGARTLGCGWFDFTFRSPARDRTTSGIAAQSESAGPSQTPLTKPSAPARPGGVYTR